MVFSLGPDLAGDMVFIRFAVTIALYPATRSMGREQGGFVQVKGERFSIMRDLVRLDDVGSRTLKLCSTRSTANFGARENRGS